MKTPGLATGAGKLGGSGTSSKKNANIAPSAGTGQGRKRGGARSTDTARAGGKGRVSGTGRGSAEQAASSGSRAAGAGSHSGKQDGSERGKAGGFTADQGGVDGERPGTGRILLFYFRRAESKKVKSVPAYAAYLLTPTRCPLARHVSAFPAAS